MEYVQFEVLRVAGDERRRGCENGFLLGVLRRRELQCNVAMVVLPFGLMLPTH